MVPARTESIAVMTATSVPFRAIPPLPSIARSLLQATRCAAEHRAQLGAERKDGDDHHHTDRRDDEAVFDHALCLPAHHHPRQSTSTVSVTLEWIGRVVRPIAAQNCSYSAVSGTR